MNTIVCPHCQSSFSIEDSDYNEIVSRIRNTEFKKSVELAVEAEKAKSQGELQVLKAKLDASEIRKDAAVKEAKFCLESQIAELEMKLEIQTRDAKSELEHQLRMKDEEIAYYKDFKARQSTKMVGESLEKYCKSEFDKVRAMGFPNAYFEKDNSVSASGSKGDFIFRDYENEKEYVSIMFEMKNENDTTATKHTNSDFFKELDKDRREKHCDYAVLVSMLESDSEYYNQGIVDVSYKYPKMYVIRPQFLLPIITILRNTARSSLSLSEEIERLKGANLDMARLENDIADFQDKYSKNYELASRKFDETIDSIDKAIKQLQKAKDALLSSNRNYRLANDKITKLRLNMLR